jgi:hypothetical protein
LCPSGSREAPHFYSQKLKSRHAFSLKGGASIYNSAFRHHPPGGHKDFGIFRAIITLVIATTMSILVILFFMYVKYSGKHIAWVILSGIFFLAAFTALTLCDYLSRTWVGQG